MHRPERFTHGLHSNTVILHALRQLVGLEGYILRVFVVLLCCSQNSLHCDVVGHLDLIKELHESPVLVI